MKVQGFLVAVLCVGWPLVTSQWVVTSLSQPDQRHRRLLRDLSPDDDNSTVELEAPPKLFQSRLGRLDSSPSVQSHRSNVAYTIDKKMGGVWPPAPPPLSPSSIGTRPPAPPPTGPQPPAPPLQVQATISAPGIGLASTPVFEERPSINPVTSSVCQILPADSAPGAYKLQVTNLDACGVRSCPQDNQAQLCLTLRLPVVNGLKLPEDDIVEIRCKQQDRTVDEMKDIDLVGLEVAPVLEQKSPVTFSGGRQEFLCEIGLFRRLPGTSLFSQRIRSGSDVQLGEEVQLRSIVRSNDGWFYSKLTEVVVTRLKKAASVSGQGKASLVTSDGCRNPAFKAIAPQHPVRDSRSSLLNNFNFRVFLFQDMNDSDSILISARVIACVEAIDCAPTSCNDDRGKGYGRRKRSSDIISRDSDSHPASGDVKGKGLTREILIEKIIYPNGTLAAAPTDGLKGWETDLTLRVAMPDDYEYSGVHRRMHQSLEEHCFLYLILTVVLATALGSAIILVSLYCLCQRRRNSSSAAKTVSAPTIPTVTESSIETLMEACYPQLQVLDALSRSVREKKQHVRDQLKANVYSQEPGVASQPSVHQVKQRPRHVNDIYWEIGQPSSILPPTRV